MQRASLAADPTRRMIAPGFVSLAAASLLMIFAGVRLAATLMAAALDQAQRALLPGRVPAEMASLAERATKTMRRVATLELVSLTPVVVATVALFVVALGLMARRHWALPAARWWAIFAVAAAAASAILQFALLLPELRAVEEALARILATASRPSVVVPTMVRASLPAAGLALWASALFAWAWQLERLLPPPNPPS
jgi:hypothetical protein